MNSHRNCGASGMFVFNNIPSFMELWRKYILWFYAATHKRRQFSRRCHCFVVSAVIRFVEALGVRPELPSVFFFMSYVCLYIYVHCKLGPIDYFM